MPLRILLSLFIYIFLTFTKNAFCLSEEKVTLQDCLIAALKRSQTLEMNKELINQAKLSYDISIRSVLPNISGVKNFGWPKAPNGKSSFTSTDASVESTTKLTLTQPLFQGFKEFAVQKESKAIISATEFDHKQAKISLYHDLILNYYTIISLENDIHNAQEEITHFNERINDLKVFIKIGRSQMSDQLTTSLQAQTLKAQIKQLLGALESQRAILFYYTGFDKKIALKKTTLSKNEFVDLARYLEKIDMRPDVQSLLMKKIASEEAISIAKADHWPSLYLQGDYFFERNGIYKKNNWDVMLNLVLPLFSWGTINAQVEQSLSKKRLAFLQVEESKKQAQLEIMKLFETYKGDREEYLGFVEATEFAEKVFKAQKIDYKKGLVTNLDVLSSLINYQESKRARDRSYFLIQSDQELIELAAGMKDLPKEDE